MSGNYGKQNTMLWNNLPKKKKNESEKVGRSLEINTKRRIDSFFMYVFTYAWEGIYEGTSR